MGETVSRLDKSGWTDGARRREAKFAQWREAAAKRAEWDASPAGQAYARAVEAHPLRNVVAEQVSEESLAATEAGAPWYFQQWEAGNGHSEAFAMRKHVDPQAAVDRAIRRDLAWMVPRGLGDRERSVESAAQRSKKQVRRLCKAMQVNSLWSLTYRANVTDRDRVLAHLDAFRRRVAKVIDGWCYVAVLERQERGAFHIHLATHALPVHLYSGGVKVKSWNVMRAIWRSVVGELGGNFDESKRQHWWKPGARHTRSCTAIASYIAGYVAKDMLEGELNRKRYSASKGIEVPECYRAWIAADRADMADLVELAYAGVGERITRSWFDAERGVFFVEADDSSVPYH